VGVFAGRVIDRVFQLSKREILVPVAVAAGTADKIDLD